jgi:hypothetical protein
VLRRPAVIRSRRGLVQMVRHGQVHSRLKHRSHRACAVRGQESGRGSMGGPNRQEGRKNLKKEHNRTHPHPFLAARRAVCHLGKPDGAHHAKASRRALRTRSLRRKSFCILKSPSGRRVPFPDASTSHSNQWEPDAVAVSSGDVQYLRSTKRPEHENGSASGSLGTHRNWPHPQNVDSDSNFESQQSSIGSL